MNTLRPRLWSTLVVLLGVTGIGSAGEPDAAAVLDRVRAAVGYEHIAGQGGGMMATGSATVAGIECTTTIMFSGDRACVQRIDGPISTSSAMDGDTIWISDIGGETRRAYNADRATTELGLLILCYGYLGSDRPLKFEVDEAACTPGSIALSFHGSTGPAKGTLLIDRETALPQSWSYDVGAGRTNVTLGDYHELKGVKIPGRVTTMSHGGSSVHLRLDTVSEAPTFVRSPYQFVDGAPNDAAFDAQVSPELEVVKAPTGHLLVHPLINGKDLGWFIFDTGAGNSVLTTAVIKELGLEEFGDVPAKGVGGTSQASFCRPATLTLGPITMNEPLMVGLDLSFLDVHMGRRVAGLIGYNLLARAVTRIDMVAPAISIYDPATYDGSALPWQNLVIDQRIPHIEASFEGHTGLFRLDTGAAQMSVSMHEPAVRRLNLLEGRETKDSKSGGVGGMVSVLRGELAWFDLAGHRTERVRAEFATQATGAFSDPFSLGNIGGVLLRPFVFITDYRRDRIAFVLRPEEKQPAAPK